MVNDIVSSPSSGNSPASIDSFPETPVSPNPVQTLALPASDPAVSITNTSVSNSNSNNSLGSAKRKPSRRANTAERRATHNAVERQRRETLNSRFLDLAALLPNLSQIRRPSKSAIVNSSIAHIHAARRHRAMAARELRLVKSETDALRRELNEWRDRASLPRVEEPARSDAFNLVLSGEVEIMPVIPGMMDEEEDGADDDDFAATVPTQQVPPPPQSASPDHDAYLARVYAAQQQQQQHLARMTQQQQQQQAYRGPLIASGTSGIAFENPALPPTLYDAHPPHIPSTYQQQVHQHNIFDDVSTDKHGWSSQLLAAQQQIQFQQAQQQAHHSPYGTPTPPGSGHGFSAYNQNGGRLFGSPVDDMMDSSSVASSIGRARSSSMGASYGAGPCAAAGAFPLVLA